MTFRPLAIALLAAATLTAACQKKPAPAAPTLNFSVLSAESAQSMSALWEPVITDMRRKTGLDIKAFYGSNYSNLIEAMRFGQVQVGWYSALPALEAVRRAQGHVIARVVMPGGSGSYQSVLIVPKGRGLTLDKVLKCDKSLTFGIGDAKSTSGTLAPLTYVFKPRGIDPQKCFKIVRTGNQQTNMFAVGSGVLDVATNNTVGLEFVQRQRPDIAKKIEVIWTSPDLPESSIVVRKDLDPTAVAKLRDFFITYGKAAGADGDRERDNLKRLAYQGFSPADDSYLQPIRDMEAALAKPGVKAP
ncbi:MAG: phosphate/phosphite/phosphonate ABC transporter substrate-binding protein [Caulobacteraceae bacterium]